MSFQKEEVSLAHEEALSGMLLQQIACTRAHAIEQGILKCSFEQ